jgi:hypothetical protein
MPTEVMVKPHYVYEYWTPDTNECFYVGKGIAGRAENMKNRNFKFHLVVRKLSRKKLKPVVKITNRFKTNREARLKESQRILYFIHKGHPLANHQIFTRGIESFLLRARLTRTSTNTNAPKRRATRRTGSRFAGAQQR